MLALKISFRGAYVDLVKFIISVTVILTINTI